VSATLRIDQDRGYRELVVAEVAHWQVSYGASSHSTVVHMRGGGVVHLDGDHGNELRRAVEAMALEARVAR